MPARRNLFTCTLAFAALLSLAGCGGSSGGSGGSAPPPAPPAAMLEVVTVDAPPAGLAQLTQLPTLDFSQPMPATLAANGLTLTGPLGNLAFTSQVSGSTVRSSPAEPLTAGTRYSFVASTALRSASGQPLAAARTIAIDTPAAAWSAAQPVATPAGGALIPVRLRLLRSGDGVAVWQDSSTGGVFGRQYAAARYNAAANRWTQILTWQNNTAAVDVSPQGDVFAVSRDGVLAVSRLPAGAGQWEPAVALSSQPSLADAVRLVFDDAGNAVVAWAEAGASASLSYARFDAAAKRWSAVGTVAAASRDAQLFGAPDGRAWLVDYSPNTTVPMVGYRSGVTVRRFDPATGQWSAAQTLQSGVWDIRPSALAANAAGAAVLAWAQKPMTAGPYEIRAARLSAGGSAWSQAALVHTTPNNLKDLSVVLDAAGNATAAWSAAIDGQAEELRVARMVAQSGAWETPRVQATSSPGFASPLAMQLALDPSGNAVLAWLNTDAAGNWVRTARRYSITSGLWETETAVRRNAAGQGPGLLAVDAMGQAMALWPESLSLDANNLYYARMAVPR